MKIEIETDDNLTRKILFDFKAETEKYIRLKDNILTAIDRTDTREELIELLEMYLWQ